jgi:nitroreductase
VWSALYPAAQNLIVAARSLGLGTTFTTFHMFMESELRELLEIPKEIKFGVVIQLAGRKTISSRLSASPSQA